MIFFNISVSLSPQSYSHLTLIFLKCYSLNGSKKLTAESAWREFKELGFGHNTKLIFWPFFLSFFFFWTTTRLPEVYEVALADLDCTWPHPAQTFCCSLDKHLLPYGLRPGGTFIRFNWSEFLAKHTPTSLTHGGVEGEELNQERPRNLNLNHEKQSTVSQIKQPEWDFFNIHTPSLKQHMLLSYRLLWLTFQLNPRLHNPPRMKEVLD